MPVAATGKTYVLTGRMQYVRADIEAAINAAGGCVKERVVKGETDYLVIADPSSTSTKATAARQKGVRVISVDDLLQHLGKYRAALTGDTTVSPEELEKRAKAEAKKADAIRKRDAERLDWYNQNPVELF